MAEEQLLSALFGMRQAHNSGVNEGPFSDLHSGAHDLLLEPLTCAKAG